jgi:hypothetical protein
MVAEEAEVFRKGLALGVDAVASDSEDEDAACPGAGLAGESGEELKKEILEAEIDEDLLAAVKGGPRRGSRGSFTAEEAERPDFAVGGAAGEVVE